MNKDTHAERILIIDFGSQVTQLIARRLREAGIYTEILPCTTDPEKIKTAGSNGIILSGGPNSVTVANTPRAPQVVFDLGVPVLGICYGHQAIAHALGGEVKRHKEGWGAGITSVNIESKSKWLKPSLQKINLYAMHQDQVTKLPNNATRFLSNDFCNISGFLILLFFITLKKISKKILFGSPLKIKIVLFFI